jgi:hypothetical protein
MDGESESLALRIRLFFRDLLGSRMTAHLGEELLRLRTDFEQRLQEKDLIAATLREEKNLLMSKVTMYEMTIMPHASRVGAEVVAYQKPVKPAFSFIDIPAPKSRWQVVQDEHDAQMEKEIEEDKVKAAAAAKE